MSITLKSLKTYAEGISKIYPQHDDTIRSIYYLAVTEVETGESEPHECELAMEDIKQTIAHE